MNRPDKEASSPATCQSSRSILWLENIAKTIDWIVIPLNKKFRFITRMVLALMILYVVLDVLMRLIFSSSLIGTIEIQEFALVIIAFLGFAPEESDRNHIRVELFLQFLPKWVTALLGNIFQLGCFVLFSVVTRYAVAQIIKKLNVVSISLKLPVSIFIGIAAIGLLFLAIALFRNFILSTIEVIKYKKTPFLFFSFVFGLSIWLFPNYIASLAPIENGLVLGALVLLFLFIVMFLGMPIGFAMTLAGYVGLLLVMPNSAAVGNLAGITPYHATATYLLAVLPAFLVMGTLVYYSGISHGLFNAANNWLGRLPGGVAIASVVGCAFFGAVCGDSLATAVTMSKVALPEMRNKKYSSSIAAGSLAAGGTLGILIPPSIGFIIYAIITEENVGRLFIAGIIPGVILAFLFAAVIFVIAKRYPEICPRGERYPLSEKMRSLKGILPVIILFIFILGGMLKGFFSPNEAGATGTIGALVIALIGRNLTLKSLISSLDETAAITARVFVIVIGVGLFGYFLAATQIPFLLADFVSGLTLNRYVILAILCILYIILGCLMNVIPMIMLTMPTIFPTIIALGFDPIWFGVLIVVLMEMGQITPPIGINVFAISTTAGDIPMQAIFKGITPFFICMSVMILILIIFPQLALFLPGLMF